MQKPQPRHYQEKPWGTTLLQWGSDIVWTVVPLQNTPSSCEVFVGLRDGERLKVIYAIPSLTPQGAPKVCNNRRCILRDPTYNTKPTKNPDTRQYIRVMIDQF